MPDTVRTLSALQTLLADNVIGDISPQDVRDMLVSTYQLDYSADTSITGTATATISKWHICTGTTSDYTVTLPAASGNAGKMIGLRMSSALTKLVTIDGNGAELIDGTATRIMWANEVAILFCDGTGWTKIAGKSIPMTCSMSKSSATSCTTGTSTHSAMNTIGSESPAGLGNTGSGQIDIKRACNGLIYAETVFNTASGTSANTQAAVWKNASSTGQATSVFYYGAYGGPITSAYMTGLAAGDNIRAYLYQTYGTTESTFAGADYLRFLEIPTW